MAIVEHNRVVREGLAAMSVRSPDVRVIAASVADGALFVEARPDVLVLDVRLRDQDAVHLAAALRKQVPTAKIVAMDVVPAAKEIIGLLNAGVNGFVSKDATFDEFVSTVRLVAAGETVLPAGMRIVDASQLAKGSRGWAVERNGDDAHTTLRECQVIRLIGDGLSNIEIAEQLGIATHTVKSHVRHIMEKLAVHTRLEIAAVCYKSGFASEHAGCC